MNVYDPGTHGRPPAADAHVAVDTAGGAADIVAQHSAISAKKKGRGKAVSGHGRLKSRADGSRSVINAAGCVAQAEGRDRRRRPPSMIVVMLALYHTRCELVLRRAQAVPEADRWIARAIDTCRRPARNSIIRPPAAIRGRAHSLTVQEGCDKFPHL
jgi:tRNA A37 methylthiotransferase MiaB